MVFLLSRIILLDYLIKFPMGLPTVYFHPMEPFFVGN